MLALGLVLRSLLCSVLENSKQARNLHVVLHDVQIMVKKHGLSSLSFKNKLNKTLHRTPFKRARKFGEAGGTCLVGLF